MAAKAVHGVDTRAARQQAEAEHVVQPERVEIGSRQAKETETPRQHAPRETVGDVARPILPPPAMEPGGLEALRRQQHHLAVEEDREVLAQRWQHAPLLGVEVVVGQQVERLAAGGLAIERPLTLVVAEALSRLAEAVEPVAGIGLTEPTVATLVELRREDLPPTALGGT